MTKSEKRQFANQKGRDGFIQVEGYLPLNIRFNQVEFQTPKHGEDHGLPVSNQGKTTKTEENVIALLDSLADRSNRQTIV